MDSLFHNRGSRANLFASAVSPRQDFVMAAASVVQSDETSREYVAYLLVKMIDDAEDHPKRNRKQILDLYAECAIAVRNPAQRRRLPQVSQVVT